MSGNDYWLQGRQDPVLHSIDWTLDAMIARNRTAVSKELLHHSRVSVEETLGRVAEQLILQIETAVYQHTVEVERDRVPFRREVPWSTTVMVEHERTWWQRLWRRPARTTWHEIEGEVAVSGEVPVSATFAARFPDLPHYPPEWGAPIRVASMDWGPVDWTAKVTETDRPHIYDPGER